MGCGASTASQPMVRHAPPKCTLLSSKSGKKKGTRATIAPDAYKVDGFVACSKFLKGFQLKEGDQVIVHPDMATLKESCDKTNCGWSEDKEEYIISLKPEDIGTVGNRDWLGEGRRVQWCDGHWWSFPMEVLAVRLASLDASQRQFWQGGSDEWVVWSKKVDTASAANQPMVSNVTSSSQESLGQPGVGNKTLLTTSRSSMKREAVGPKLERTKPKITKSKAAKSATSAATVDEQKQDMSKAAKTAMAVASRAQHAELMAMKKGELRRLARANGASIESLDAADDLEDSKAALVATILAVQAATLSRPVGKKVGSLRSSESASPADSRKSISKRNYELGAQQSHLPNCIPDEDDGVEAPVPNKSRGGGGKKVKQIKAKDATTVAVKKLKGKAKKTAKEEIEKLSEMCLDSAEEAIDICLGKTEDALKAFVGEEPESEAECEEEEESEGEEEEEEQEEEEEEEEEEDEEEEEEEDEEEDEEEEEEEEDEEDEE